MKLTFTKEIDVSRVRELLCCAIEGGSAYWAIIEKFVYPPGTTAEDFNTGGRCQLEEHWPRSMLLPFMEGGAVIIGDKEDQGNGKRLKGSLDLASIERGFQVLFDKHPDRLSEFLAENEDADTGDVFLQCCLFGEIVFG